MATKDGYESLLQVIRTYRFRGFQRPQIERLAKDNQLPIERFEEAWSSVLLEEEEAAAAAIEAQKKAELEEEQRAEEHAASNAELAQAHATPSGFGTSGPPEIERVEL